ncbi:MAG: LysE family translocator [Alphaproteobacteria bacterium]|nr:LysE family translocator [Alphaproteobacteria bacterium]
MTDYILIQGLVFGFFLALPVGPVGVLCVQRTLAEGRMHGLLSGLGAAFGDALYGAVAAFGISAVKDWLEAHQDGLRIAGGAVLLVLAVRTVYGKNGHSSRAPKGKINEDRVVTHSLVKDFVSTFMLAVTNPITLIAFAGLLATLGITEAGASVGNASILVVGVFAGSASWWIAISTTAGALRPFVDGTYQAWMNRVSAVILFGFGFYALLSGFGITPFIYNLFR